MPGQDRSVRNVPGNRRLAQPTRPDQNGIARTLQELQAHQLADRCPIALLRPVPIEIRERLEAADVRLGETALPS